MPDIPRKSRWRPVESPFPLVLRGAFRHLHPNRTEPSRSSFVVEFAIPDAATRAAIWRGVVPAATPTEALDQDQLARLRVAGGNIRNIALAAAFRAADAVEPPVDPVDGARMTAARGEYAETAPAPVLRI